jgi:hypothetical protein
MFRRWALIAIMDVLSVASIVMLFTGVFSWHHNPTGTPQKPPSRISSTRGTTLSTPTTPQTEGGAASTATTYPHLRLTEKTRQRLAYISPSPSRNTRTTPNTTPTSTQSTAESARSVNGWGCAAALAYLADHAAPGFTYSCTGCVSCRPQAETYVSAPDRGHITINDPCPVAYENEANNSKTWGPYGPGGGWLWYANNGYSWEVQHEHGLDPYGYSC